MTTSHDSPVHSRTAVAIAGGVAVLCGMLVALQSRINAQFANELGDAVLAALISFGFGLIILSVILVFARRGRDGLGTLRVAVGARRIPWWYLTGGGFGALFVVSQGLSAAIIGVALFTIAAVAGQTVSGTIIDRRGLGTMAPKPVTVVRVFAAALAVGAVILAGSAELSADVPLPLLVLPLLAGLGVGWQQAANGQVRSSSGSALTATFVNFIVGTAVLLVATLVHLAVTGWSIAQLPDNPLLYAGGAIGVVFIGGATVVVRITGVLLLGLATTAGQLIGATLLDILVPVEGHVISVTTVIGIALTLIAVSIAALPRRRA